MRPSRLCSNLPQRLYFDHLDPDQPFVIPFLMIVLFDSGQEMENNSGHKRILQLCTSSNGRVLENSNMIVV